MDPAAEEAVDHTVVAAHESTMDRPHIMKGYAILSIHHRSHGPGLLRVGRGGECAGGRSSAVVPRRKFANTP
jgi:hypothetical protein